MNELEIQKQFFRPICNEFEIERIFNVQNSEDLLLKIRAETISINEWSGSIADKGFVLFE